MSLTPKKFKIKCLLIRSESTVDLSKWLYLQIFGKKFSLSLPTFGIMTDDMTERAWSSILFIPFLLKRKNETRKIKSKLNPSLEYTCISSMHIIVQPKWFFFRWWNDSFPKLFFSWPSVLISLNLYLVKGLDSEY